MIDFVSFIFDFFVFCFLLLIVILGLTLAYRMFKAMFFNSNNKPKVNKQDKQIKEVIMEDSQADGLMTLEDNEDLFPEEFDEEEE
jgi:hypothetical protein